MEYMYIGIEFPYRIWFQDWVQQQHPLTDVPTLQLIMCLVGLQRETSEISNISLTHHSSIDMNGFHCDLLEYFVKLKK